MRRKTKAIIVVVIIIYVWLSMRPQHYSQEGIIDKGDPESVWMFLSDFSKLKTINPTILDFKIGADHGNRDHWKYTVHYAGRLFHWPYLNHKSVAHIEAKRTGSTFLVESEHSVCFGSGEGVCLQLSSIFELSSSDQSRTSTNYKESVKYSCLPLMTTICEREVIYQREVIFQNLRQHFHSLAHG